MLFRKCYILFLILIVCPVLLLAQNYCTVNKTSVNFFLGIGVGYKPLKINSSQIIKGDTVLYPVIEKTIKNYDSTYTCFYIDSTSIIGKKVKLKKNGINIFYNNAGKEIIINTLSRPGDTWTMFQCPDSSRFEAKVDIVYFDQIFPGIYDSVKVIFLSYFDKFGNKVNHTTNNAQISISKNHGFINFWNFIDLPDINNNHPFITYSLIGMSDPKVGYQNLDASLIYNFNIGDEIHSKQNYNYHYSYQTMPGYILINIDTFCIRKILDKTETDDSFYYTVYRHQYTNYDYYDDHTYPDSIIKDSSNTKEIIRERYPKKNKDLDRLPEEVVGLSCFLCIVGPSANRMVKYQNIISFGSIRTKENANLSQWKYYFEDTCVFYCQDYYSDYEKYYEGLGGPFYYRAHDCYSFNEWSEQKELVYFKTAINVWGTPIILKDPMPPTPSNSFYITPNPVSYKMKVSSHSEKNIDKLIFIDFSGKIIKQVNNVNSPLFEMDCSFLNNGLYILTIISGTDIFRKQLLILR